MRALINASAHMYWFWVGAPKKEKADTTGDEDNPKKREGQYPVY